LLKAKLTVFLFFFCRIPKRQKATENAERCEKDEEIKGKVGL